MLRYKGIAADGPDHCEFRILDGDSPAAPAVVDRVARIAAVLLEENALAGAFRVAGAGRLALDLVKPERSFFHSGIVFAALDAVNDPIKSPTLTLRADEPG
ncbi:MAG TPA: hypothetical protein VGG65_06110 [Thermoanaerobaculia bacterium]